MAGVETDWLETRKLLGGARTAGELRAPSSFLTGAEFEGVGDAIEPEALLARSSWSKLGAGTAEVKGFRPLAPFAAGVETGPGAIGWGAGESAGLGLPGNLRVIFWGGGADLLVVNLIRG